MAEQWLVTEIKNDSKVQHFPLINILLLCAVYCTSGLKICYLPFISLWYYKSTIIWIWPKFNDSISDFED